MLRNTRSYKQLLLMSPVRVKIYKLKGQAFPHVIAGTFLFVSSCDHVRTKPVFCVQMFLLYHVHLPLVLYYKVLG